VIRGAGGDRPDVLPKGATNNFAFLGEFAEARPPIVFLRSNIL
jgi:myosin-crossreactive antigen